METDAKSTADEQQVLNHADPEQKDVQERFFNEQTKATGPKDGCMCAVHVCVSGYVMCG